MEETDEPRRETEAPRASKTLHRVGFVITGVWISGLLLYGALNYRGFLTLAPNELGDFAAGAFAPLAFLWLVLGFFQQGEELRYSGRALWLQGEELRNSVEQQRDLVNVTREQLQFESEVLAAQREDLERSAQPILELRGGGNSPGENREHRRYTFRIFNHGRPCTDFKALIDGHQVVRQAVVPSGEWADFTLQLPIAEDAEIDVNLTYVDERLSRKSVHRRIVKTGIRFDFFDL